MCLLKVLLCFSQKYTKFKLRFNEYQNNISKNNFPFTFYLNNKTATSGLINEDVTGTTPPPVPCMDSMCQGKSDGNYAYYYNGDYRANYFIQCVGGLSQCQACFPMSLEFSQDCNQCLYSKYGIVLLNTYQFI